MARALIQTVTAASVVVEGNEVGRIDSGLLIYVGAARNDTASAMHRLARKTLSLRLFAGPNGRPFEDAIGPHQKVLLVSNFTLLGDVSSGRKPSWSGAAAPSDAEQLVDEFRAELEHAGILVEQGVFGAEMYVSAVVHGPLNLIIEVDA